MFYIKLNFFQSTRLILEDKLFVCFCLP